MHLSKGSCAPVYFGPEIIRDSALKKLKALKDLKSSRQWVDDSTIFLNRDGSFSHRVIEERSFRVCTQKVSLFMARLFSASGSEAATEEQRLRNARRRLLVSLLAHAWLWGRPKVLDNRGNPVAFEDRRVLAPHDILNFLDRVRAGTASFTHEEVCGFLVDDAQEVALYKDMSKWNLRGVIACLRWDKAHNLRDEGPWCSCRLERKGLPPPYGEMLERKELPPPYDEVCPTKISLWRSTEGKTLGCEVEMPKA